jgi:hypothetical protein
MKAIQTKYHGATNYRGSRIIATADDNPRLTQPYNREGEATEEDVHRRAAYALRDKLGWKGELVGGWKKDSYYWVFV